MNHTFKIYFLITLLISIDLILTPPLPEKGTPTPTPGGKTDTAKPTEPSGLFALIETIKEKKVITIPAAAYKVIQKLSTKNAVLTDEDKKILKACRDAAANNNSKARDRPDRNTAVGQIFFVT